MGNAHSEPIEDTLSDGTPVVFVTESDKNVPPVDYSLWKGEAYTSAQLANGFKPDEIFPGIGMMFPGKKDFGFYAFDPRNPTKRLAEREAVPLLKYLRHVEYWCGKDIDQVSARYPACANLAALHRKVCEVVRYLYSEEEMEKILYYAGLALDETMRGTDLSMVIQHFSLKRTKESTFTKIIVATTGHGSAKVYETIKESGSYKVELIMNLPYHIKVPISEKYGAPRFRVYEITL